MRVLPNDEQQGNKGIIGIYRQRRRLEPIHLCMLMWKMMVMMVSIIMVIPMMRQEFGI